jgi:hypothetical protein
MTTIDNLLLNIVNYSSTPVEELMPNRDCKVLRNMAVAISNNLFVTENQSQLLIKILQENCEKLSDFSEEIKKTLATPSWSKPFRHIEQIRKFYIDKNDEQDLLLFVEMSFNSEIRKILMNLSKNLENLVAVGSQKLWSCDLNEKNLVLLYEALEPLEFEIHETIKNHYNTIKSWSEDEFKNQFLLTAMTNTNFHRVITADLGIETAIDQTIINDRSMRYQYFVENPKNPGETLVEYIANRSRSRVWINKDEHDLTQVIASLKKLKRLPLLVVFDTFASQKYMENLEILKEALENNNITDNIGIYFRLSNDEAGKKFNKLIADKKYNYPLDNTTTVAGVMSGKIPKFFLKNPWQPMSVLALDTKMGLRHGKTSVYANCCDLIVEWASEPTMFDHRKAIK